MVRATSNEEAARKMVGELVKRFENSPEVRRLRRKLYAKLVADMIYKVAFRPLLLLLGLVLLGWQEWGWYPYFGCHLVLHVLLDGKR